MAAVSAFDFIKLGYNVEWPVNLIITPESFTIYNSIFSFLIRAKLAVHALQDIWQLMKVNASEIWHLSLVMEFGVKSSG